MSYDPEPFSLRAATADPLACVLDAEPCSFHMLSEAGPCHESWAKADLTMCRRDQWRTIANSCHAVVFLSVGLDDRGRVDLMAALGRRGRGNVPGSWQAANCCSFLIVDAPPFKGPFDMQAPGFRHMQGLFPYLMG